MTIHELLALTGLTESDEIPVWDEEASGEPTKKITAQNFAAAIKTLASLLGTSDVVNDLTSTATDKPLSANMGHELDARLDRFSKDTGIIWRLDVTDINTIRQTGNYYANNNCPNAISGGGYLTVLKYDDSYVLQTMFPYNSPNMYVRVLNNNVWSNWKSMM